MWSVLGLDDFWHEEHPHQSLVVCEGPLRVLGDGSEAGGGVLSEEGGDGAGHGLSLEHLTVQAPGLDQHGGDVVTVIRR